MTSTGPSKIDVEVGIGQKVERPLALGTSRLRIEIRQHRRADKPYIVRLSVLAMDGNRWRAVPISDQGYSTEAEAWIAIQRLAQDRICNLADVEEVES